MCHGLLYLRPYYSNDFERVVHAGEAWNLAPNDHEHP
jgi:hypothetical protein